MSLPAFSVGRPVFTSMVMLIVTALGLSALSHLKVDLLPSIELPTVSVRTGYDGASPEVVEAQVTQMLEEIVATVPGVERIESRSMEGRSNLRIQFAWGKDVDAAALEVQSKIEDELNELPEDVRRPWVGKFDIQGFPVVILGISSGMDPVEMTELINRQIRYRFARIPGVAQVDLFGGFNREIRVELDPIRLEALGLPLNQVLQALRDANLDRPSGRIEEGRHELALRAPAHFRDVDEIRNTVIAIRDGDPVALGQVATVLDTYERPTEIDRVNGRRGLRVGIRKQAEANTVEVSRAILEEIERVNADYPQLEILAVSNSGNFIERSIANVARSVLYGGVLSVLVLLFFLRDWRSTLVISLSIPISVVATFALLYFSGFSLNLMSLGGLALGVGMMVDSSIVVLENIFRRHSSGTEAPAAAASRGAGEVAAAIVASTLTTLVIFLPVVFIQGVSGQLFREMAYVVSFSLVCSLGVSLSLVPMLAARLLAGRGAVRGQGEATLRSRLGGGAERAFQRLEEGYAAIVGAAVHRRAVTVLAAAALLAGSVVAGRQIGTELMPPSDEGEVRIDGEMEVGTRLDLVDEVARGMEALVVKAVPEMRANVVEVAPGTVEMDLSLGPATQRQRSNTEIAAHLREVLGDRIPGMEVRVRAREGQFLLNRLLGGGESGIEIEVRGYELDTLRALAQRAAEVVAPIPGVADVDLGFDEGVPQRELRVDRDKAANLGLSARDVSEALQTAIAGSQAGEYRTEGQAYRILVQLADAQSLSMDQVLDLTLRTPTGDLVALRNVVTDLYSRAPTEIERRDQQRLVTVRVNLGDRPLGDVARDILAALDTIPRPSGYLFRLAGAYEEQQAARRDFTLAIGLALALVFMVLACQYESLRDPLIVMVAAPMAAVGVVLTLLLTQTTFNLQSGIGCVMLAGITVNNAILLVDQASRLCREGMPVSDAVREAGRRRLRPILMTTLTTALGLLPLALGVGEGADAQAPLARAVIGGLMGSTVITLVLVPAVYSLVHGAVLSPGPVCRLTRLDR
ncbi:MAG: efflux RND transporter permease subunit [Verrucomicrobiae bacterium]|nr:efflux RND transporter permease subunit [Verrucomicrobiae bacterium]